MLAASSACAQGRGHEVLGGCASALARMPTKPVAAIKRAFLPRGLYGLAAVLEKVGVIGRVFAFAGLDNRAIALLLSRLSLILPLAVTDDLHRAAVAPPRSAGRSSRRNSPGTSLALRAADRLLERARLAGGVALLDRGQEVAGLLQAGQDALACRCR